MLSAEQHNHRQIEQLNQRGGRTLSIVDLIRAGTLNVPMAAYAMRAMQQGASLLTAARPGGAGKTTLMAALLNLLPPGIRLVTVDDPRVIRQRLGQAAAEPACYLAHEIGSGDWYGYIWGRDVADFFALIGDSYRVASCLHADTMEELIGILCGPPLRVARMALGRVGLVLFMHVARGPRVSSPRGQLLGERWRRRPSPGLPLERPDRCVRAHRCVGRTGRLATLREVPARSARRGRGRCGDRPAQGRRPVSRPA